MADMHEFSEPLWGEHRAPTHGRYSWQLFRFNISPAWCEGGTMASPGGLSADADIVGLIGPVASLRGKLMAYENYIAVHLCRINSDSDTCTFELLVCTSRSLPITLHYYSITRQSCPPGGVAAQPTIPAPLVSRRGFCLQLTSPYSVDETETQSRLC
jgi:hypothetical protein